jgi:hypothetical protein
MELWLAYSVALGKWIGRVELWRGGPDRREKD